MTFYASSTFLVREKNHFAYFVEPENCTLMMILRILSKSQFGCIANKWPYLNNLFLLAKMASYSPSLSFVLVYTTKLSIGSFSSTVQWSGIGTEWFGKGPVTEQYRRALENTG